MITEINPVRPDVKLYHGLHIRDYFKSKGFAVRRDFKYLAPDIIPYAQETLSIDEATASYAGIDLGKAICYQAPNHIYVRAKNMGSTTEGNVHLYFVDASLNVADTSKWQRVLTADGKLSAPLMNAHQSRRIKSDEIALTTSPFVLNCAPDQGRNYCFCAMIETAEHPVSLPKPFSSQSALVDWLSQHPNVSWRNVFHFAADTAVLKQSFHFANAHTDTRAFHFSILGQNMLVSASVNIQSTHANCAFNKTLLMPTLERGEQRMGFDKHIPGHFNGTVNVTIRLRPGQSFARHSSVSVQLYQYPWEKDPLDAQVCLPYRVVSEHGERGIDDLILVGECMLMAA